MPGVWMDGESQHGQTCLEYGQMERTVWTDMPGAWMGEMTVWTDMRGAWTDEEQQCGQTCVICGQMERHRADRAPLAGFG